MSTLRQLKATHRAHQKRHGMHAPGTTDERQWNMHTASTQDDTPCTENAHGMHTRYMLLKPPCNRYGMRHEMRIAYAPYTTRYAHASGISGRNTGLRMKRTDNARGMSHAGDMLCTRRYQRRNRHGLTPTIDTTCRIETTRYAHAVEFLQTSVGSVCACANCVHGMHMKNT